MRLFAAEHPFSTGVDISSSAFWAQPFAERERSFARLRAETPNSWHPPTDWHEPHEQKGFWAVTRAADIATVSKNSELFRSGSGTTLDPLAPELSTAASFFLTMDAPQHTRYRRLISAAFTPRAVTRIAEQITANARRIVDDLVGAGEVDFVEACSSRLPLATVSDMVGVPAAERERVALAAERLVGGADVRERALAMDSKDSIDKVYELLAEELFYLFGIGSDLAAHRRAHPADDLMTNLVQAQIDGVGLTDDDIGAFMVLISVAGNDTTKQSTSIGMLALQEHPEQREWLRADPGARIGTAVEEIVRWVSPVMQFTRTAAADTELDGAQISAGDKVALFYCSGNRDEAAFGHPERFDLSRAPNPHQGFGGGGAHYCLGNGVAKTQLRALFGQLLARVPELELGEPVPLPSNFIHGVTRLPARMP
jgi:cytochrome P450